jgi:hypothetical protein
MKRNVSNVPKIKKYASLPLILTIPEFQAEIEVRELVPKVKKQKGTLVTFQK